MLRLVTDITAWINTFVCSAFAIDLHESLHITLTTFFNTQYHLCAVATGPLGFITNLCLHDTNAPLLVDSAITIPAIII